VSLNNELYQTPKPLLAKLKMQWMPSSPPTLQKKSQTSLHWCYRSKARVDQLKTFLQATSQYDKYNVSIHMQEVFIYALWLLTEHLLRQLLQCYLIISSFHYIFSTALHNHMHFFFLWNIYTLFVGYIHVFMAHISCCSYFW